MAYKVYDQTSLADFTGRPEASFPETFITTSAIPQAMLLFKLATGIADPAVLSVDDQQLVDFAILSMADAIHLSAPYQAAKASPFNSESIGSYSYSKTAAAIRQGTATGIEWFDLAVTQLGGAEHTTGEFQRGGVEAWEHDGTYVKGTGPGNTRLVSPADVYGYGPFYGLRP